MCPKGWQPLSRAPAAGLDWQAFSAAYFPGSRRHNLKAIVAYAAYKRSRGAGEEQPSEAARLKADAISTEAQASTSGKTKAARRDSSTLEVARWMSACGRNTPRTHRSYSE
jgi:hypothetical protein